MLLHSAEVRRVHFAHTITEALLPPTGKRWTHIHTIQWLPLVNTINHRCIVQVVCTCASTLAQGLSLSWHRDGILHVYVLDTAKCELIMAMDACPLLQNQLAFSYFRDGRASSSTAYIVRRLSSAKGPHFLSQNMK